MSQLNGRKAQSQFGDLCLNCSDWFSFSYNYSTLIRLVAAGYTLHSRCHRVVNVSAEKTTSNDTAESLDSSRHVRERTCMEIIEMTCAGQA